MADNVTVDNGSLTDYDVATDEITSPYTGGTKHAQAVKLLSGTANANDVIPGDATNGLDVDVTRVSGNVTVVQGTATSLKVDASGVAVPITDNSGSLTVDDGGSTISIDDGGGSVTVDGTVAVSGSVTVDSELTTGDLDTGAGTDTRAVVGLVGSKSGGGVLIPGDATAGLKVDLGADNDVTVTSGTITTITNVVHVDDNSSTISVDDGGGSVTVDSALDATVSSGRLLTTGRQESYSTVTSGEFAPGTSAAQFPTITCKAVRFKARLANTGNVYIGDDASVTVANGVTDTTTGLELDGGEDTGWIPASNVNVFYGIGDNATDSVTYMILN